MKGRANRKQRNELLAENYLQQRALGNAGIVPRLSQAFDLNETYIYKLLALHRQAHPDLWSAPEQLLVHPQTLHGERLMASNAIIEPRRRVSRWQRFLNKMSVKLGV